MNLSIKLLRYNNICSYSNIRYFSSSVKQTAVFEKPFYVINENPKDEKSEVQPLSRGEQGLHTRLKELSEKFFKFSDSNPHFWAGFEAESLKNINGLFLYNFDGIMMSFLRKEKLFDKAESFFRYVEKNRNVNNVTLANFMVIAAELGDEAAVAETYQKMKKDLLVVPEIRHLVTCAFAKTSLWKHTLEIIKQSSLVDAPVWIAAASGAFKNKEYKIGMELIDEIIDSDCGPDDHVFSTWLYLIKSSRDRSRAEWLLNKFLECLRRNQLIVSLENALLLESIFTRPFPSKIRYVTMQSTGMCPECHHKLEFSTLSSEEHDQLSKAIYKNLEQGCSSYQKSSPKELQDFLNFLEQAKPYNIVLDALNVSYKQNVFHPYHLAKRLSQIVTVLVDQGYKPLLLGRKHIRTWNQQIISKVERRIKCFYADNISADDPYIIYATLHGGPNTLIMTHDLLRDHAFHLPHEVKGHFQNWRHSAQVFCQDSNGIVKIHHFKKYALRVQGSRESGWHIPYNKEIPYRYNVPFIHQRLHWLCIRKKNIF